jgi:hypothetical protein
MPLPMSVSVQLVIGVLEPSCQSSIFRFQEEEGHIPSRNIHTLVHILRLPNHLVSMLTRINIRKQQRFIQIVSSGCDVNPNIVVRVVYNTSHSFLSPFERPERSMSRAGGGVAPIERDVEVRAGGRC